MEHAQNFDEHANYDKSVVDYIGETVREKGM